LNLTQVYIELKKGLINLLKMKKLFFSVLLLFLGTSIFAQDSNEVAMQHQLIDKDLQWADSFEEAKKIAKKKNRPILVFFTGSDWCGPCKMLQQDFFNTDEFIKLADKNLVLYEADFPRRTDIITPEQKSTNFKLQGKYAVRGYPTIIFIDFQGIEIGRRSGYSFMRDPEPHFTLVKEIVNTHSN